ncbi:Trp biosynthesis-associated membrane protein [Nocardioides sp. cx-169]|uniref:Trp biosynthesis-associated membrane protein n=1 Tax=Nocardioides sp. cx-169 TaxID=2899080 RepID=UPI001E5B2B64|nr:Trp biosynthesis-associated membrane protein [Nocardioides sp. cx-169]MCD4534794.1 Trp biosynthesis-associated membrane protein [Nocardioides sp. cx-169]
MSRSGFAPLVVLGLASGVGAAVGGNQLWVTFDADEQQDSWGMASGLSESPSVPLATALGLVVLACWGVVLVSRGRPRRAVAALGALAAVGTLAAYVVGFFAAARDLEDDLAGVGLTGVDVDHTRWFWFGLACALVSAVAAVLAVRLVPRWPEMGTRYDAPGDQARHEPAAEPSNLDLWKALDEGDDPTR